MHEYYPPGDLKLVKPYSVGEVDDQVDQPNQKLQYGPVVRQKSELVHAQFTLEDGSDEDRAHRE